MICRSCWHAQAGLATHADDLMVPCLEENHRAARLLAWLVHDASHFPVDGILYRSLHAELLVLFGCAEGLLGGFFHPTLHEHLVEAAASGNRLVEERGMVSVQGDAQHATVYLGLLHVDGL